ncbi:MAG: diphthamide synthesis protein [Nanoarchaeota archaeon]
MEKLFVEARYKGKINPENIDINTLPETIGLFGSIQYIDFLEEIKNYLKSNKKNVRLFKLADYEGQILGCTIKKVEGIDAILYIGDGLFHPIALGIENYVPVYIFNPLSEKFFQLPKERIENFKKKHKAALAGFFSSKNIGVLVSLKKGQFNMNTVRELKKKNPDKNYYILLFDTLYFGQLENFSFVDCFVNTACPRISYDEHEKFNKPVVEASLILNN